MVPRSYLSDMSPVCTLVGAPAFMRGKERFSAPEKILPIIMRFSAGPREHAAQFFTALFLGGSSRIHAGEGALQRS
jgi:hypothetical protein